MQVKKKSKALLEAELSYAQRMRSLAVANNWDYDANEWDLEIKELKKCLEKYNDSKNNNRESTRGI